MCCGCIGSTPVGHESVVASSQGSTATHDDDRFAVSPNGAAGMPLTVVGHCGTSTKPATPPHTPAGACCGTDCCTRPKRCRPVVIDLFGGVAQLGERLLCKQMVAGSRPATSTILALGIAQ